MPGVSNCHAKRILTAMKLHLRDWFWLALAVGLAVGWWRGQRGASVPPSASVGQPVWIVRGDDAFGPTVSSGLVSAVSPNAFRVDTALSFPLKGGVVFDDAGNCLGVVSGDEALGTEAVSISAIHDLLTRARNRRQSSSSQSPK
jgi:hypothetical protein